MSKRGEEHYKNHPNDKPHSEREKGMIKKYQQLNHKFSISDIKHRVKIMLQKEQIRADAMIKDKVLEMYPEEYAIALQKVFDEHGMMKTQKVRRVEIVKKFRVGPEKMPKW